MELNVGLSWAYDVISVNKLYQRRSDTIIVGPMHDTTLITNTYCKTDSPTIQIYWSMHGESMQHLHRVVGLPASCLSSETRSDIDYVACDMISMTEVLIVAATFAAHFTLCDFNSEELIPRPGLAVAVFVHALRLTVSI